MPQRRRTKEIAEQFLADDTSVDLRDFTVIDDEAAEILWVYEGERLHLDGLTRLSDMAVRAIHIPHPPAHASPHTAPARPPGQC